MVTEGKVYFQYDCGFCSIGEEKSYTGDSLRDILAKIKFGKPSFELSGQEQDVVCGTTWVITYREGWAIISEKEQE